jgi:hypothetical protein
MKHTLRRKMKRKTKKHRGGFNSAQLAGAIAVAAATGMNRIVLIPNEAGRAAGSSRYEFTLNPNSPPTLRVRSGRQSLTVPGTSSTVNIKNFDIYIGSSNDLLIKIAGNESVIGRLATLANGVKNNAEPLISTGVRLGHVSQGEAEELRRDLPMLKKLADTSVNMLLLGITILFKLMVLFFKIVIRILFPVGSSPREPEPSNPPSEGAIVAMIQNPEQHLDVIQTEYDTLLEAINTLPQFTFTDEILTPVNTEFKCVTPYNRTTATVQDRVRSCNRMGPSHSKFTGRTWPLLQPCVSECYQ